SRRHLAEFGGRELTGGRGQQLLGQDILEGDEWTRHSGKLTKPRGSPRSFASHPVRRWAYSKSSARSKLGAECVSAPMEMRSTPVSAIPRTVSSETPPEASVHALPRASSTHSRNAWFGILSSNSAPAPAASAAFTCAT